LRQYELRVCQRLGTAQAHKTHFGDVCRIHTLWDWTRDKDEYSGFLAD
jgi:hypothetical protein